MANTKNFIAKNGFSTGDGYSMPDVRPSLLLDFANSKTLDPRITFTRGSTATYWDGHTTAKAEENLSTNSQTISNLSQTNTTATDNDATAPDGTTTATKIVVNTTTNAFHDAYLNAKTTVSGQPYTHSVYAKAGTGVSALYLYSTIGGTGLIAKFNISTGAYIGNASGDGYGAFDSYSITSVGNSWYRIQATKTETTGASRAFTLGVSNTTTDDVTQYNGNGTNFCHLWGIQIEQRSSATAYTATGSQPIVKYQPTLQTAASGEARFDHDPVTGESKGLLIEEARTNSLTFSEEFDHSSFTKQSVTVEANQAVAPDGTLTADKLVIDSGAATHQITKLGVVSSQTCAVSVFAKASGVNTLTLLDGATATNGASFNLSTGVAANINSGTGTMVDVGNGWYRCTAVMTTTGVRIYCPDASAQAVGDGFNGISIWGAQVEVGAFPTSYIPTSGSTVTRAVDDASMTDMSWYNYSNTMDLEFTQAGKGVGPFTMIVQAVQDGTNRWGFLQQTSTDQMRLISYNTGNLTFPVISSVTYGTEMELTMTSPDLTQVVTSVDGASAVTTSTTAFPQPTSLYIGKEISDNKTFSGHFKKIAFYPKRLSNATLQAMTEE